MRRLKKQLVDDGQILESTHPASVSAKDLEGTVIDDRQAKLVGEWGSSTTLGKFVDASYRHDGNANKGEKSATFEAKLKPGRYEVRIAYSAGSNRATNVPVAIHHQGETTQAVLNEKQTPQHDNLTTSVGTYTFDGPAKVVISNAGTDGYVIIDAVQFLPAQ